MRQKDFIQLEKDTRLDLVINQFLLILQCQIKKL
jgi:hypothetical protein